MIAQLLNYLVSGSIVFVMIYTWAVFFFEWYSWYCYERDEGHVTQDEIDYVAGKRISKDHRVLFSGPRANWIETIDIYFSHAPTFICRLILLTFHRILPFSW